jgi:hypothetical protein
MTILFSSAILSFGLTGCGSDSSETAPEGNAAANTPSGSATVNITSPQEGEEVPQEQKVTGTAADIPDGQDLWIFTVTDMAEGLRHAPQSTVIQVREDGNWTETAYVGSSDDSSVGDEYKIAIYLVPTAETASIEAYLKEAAETGQYPGFDPPEGSTEAASVTVVRK